MTILSSRKANVNTNTGGIRKGKSQFASNAHGAQGYH
jgi:hypothetical protein